MDLSAFQLFKNNARTNANSALHNTPIVQYGRIIKVIDVQTVVVEAVIQTSLAIEVYTVTLLNLSSALLEINAWPKIGDTVLLLFLQRYDPRMFAQSTVNNPNAPGYNKYSGVGILASTVKGLASTIARFYNEGETPVTETISAAKWQSTFNADLALTFCRAVFDSKDTALISVTFGESRPFMQRFLSSVTEEHGFRKNSDNELVELDAAVTEKYSIYAPIAKDIQGSQTVDVGLGTDKNDELVETEAPIKETIHGKAPVTKDIRSPQNITVGIGNDESGDAEEQRDANINILLGEKADINLISSSGLTAEIERDVNILMHSNETVNIEGDKEEAVQGPAKYTSADTDIESIDPVGVKGMGTLLGGGVLQPYWAGETEAWNQYPSFGPPSVWPMGVPVPPVPPLICMALNGIKAKIVAADAAAKAAGAKALK